jgi:hypothetical protein
MRCCAGIETRPSASPALRIGGETLHATIKVSHRVVRRNLTSLERTDLRDLVQLSRWSVDHCPLRPSIEVSIRCGNSESTLDPSVRVEMKLRRC